MADPAKYPVVYFVWDEAAEMLKIGTTSRDVRERLAHMQTGCPNELELLGWVYGGVDVERMLHARFADLRERGEWFRYDERLDAAVCDLIGNHGSPAMTEGERMHAEVQAMDAYLRGDL